MRVSQTLLATEKETPADAELVSHQLMLRAGLIRKVASGLYSWLPTGLRVMQKIEAIVRQEMHRAGAVEMLMPSVQPAELWEETNRWEKFGPQLLKMQDRHQRNFCYGPTAEEVITDILRKELKSYKQCPLNLYQMNMKFRDEIRPRFGVMRAREFLMKDSYSFHTSEACLQKTYQAMFDAYCRILDRMGLRYRAVKADTGSIGGDNSHEFHVLASAGEDILAISDESDYAANTELATSLIEQKPLPQSNKVLEKIETPGRSTINNVCEFLNCEVTKSIKSLVVKGTEAPFVMLLLRGDHTLNEIKAEKCPGIASPLTFATDEEVVGATGAPVGYLGPIESRIPVIADHHAAQLSDFVIGANEKDYHFINVNWGRDLPMPSQTADLRMVEDGDPSPDGQGRLRLTRGIEVGHVFQLGTVYSEPMKATVLSESGQPVTLHMGCYGMGVSRLVAASIEQHHDEQGIIWPMAIAPYHVVITPVAMKKSEAVQKAAEDIFQQCCNAGIDVLFDDRDERPGVMFAESELLGIPYRVVISERGLAKNQVEVKARTEEKAQEIAIDDLLATLKEKCTI